MTNSQKIKKLVGLATLTALVVGLQFLSNYVSFGSVSITLALIPIAMGAILYGPFAGAFLGAVMGVIVIVAPSTMGIFMPHNPAATIILCILKTAVAGLVAGYVFKLFHYFAKKTNNEKTAKTLFAAGIIVSTILVPVVNTALFLLGATVFFMNVTVKVVDAVTGESMEVLVFGGTFIGIINGVITTNFLIEFAVSTVLAPSLVTLVKILTSKYSLGFANDFSKFSVFDEEVEGLDSVLEKDIITEA